MQVLFNKRKIILALLSFKIRRNKKYIGGKIGGNFASFVLQAADI
jgi:hypothetical protein